MKHDADMLTEPYWKIAYGLLVKQYKLLERRLQGAFIELNEAQERANNLEEINQYLTERCEDLATDYAARLRALGVSEQDIQEFHEYWARITHEMPFDL